MTDRRRRQKEQRAAKRATEKKQRARKELNRRLRTAFLFGLSIIALFVLTAVLAPGEGELAQGYERFRQLETACGATAPAPLAPASYDSPELQPDLASASSAKATITTSCGDIVIDLAVADSPETVNSFVFLARSGYYDGQVFHRVVEDFFIHAGDPASDGTGGPGYQIDDEFPDDDFVYEPGIVAMHNVGKGTTGSQFFVVTGETASVLNPLFNVLGTVVSGQDTIDAIGEVETSQRPGTREESLPTVAVYIETITIEVTS